MRWKDKFTAQQFNRSEEFYAILVTWIQLNEKK